jgi:hypothetical protein
MDDLADTLCHYTTAEAAFQHIIPYGKLRMSPYVRMHDPLENRELTFGAAGWDDDAQAKDLMEDVVDRILLYRDQTRLLSFTIDAVSGYTEGDVRFMRAWARARMWEQYASNHAGCASPSICSEPVVTYWQSSSGSGWSARARWPTRRVAFETPRRPPSFATTSARTPCLRTSPRL